MALKSGEGSRPSVRAGLDAELLSPQDAFLLVAAVLLLVLCLYAFFYLNLGAEIDLDVDAD